MQNEVEYSKHNFEAADTTKLFTLDLYEDEAERLIGLGLVLPGYDYVLKCSHTLNLLMPGASASASGRGLSAGCGAGAHGSPGILSGKGAAGVSTSEEGGDIDAGLFAGTGLRGTACSFY